MDSALFPAGVLLLGIFVGILFYRELLNWSHRGGELRFLPCAICSTQGLVHACVRCRKDVAMCHAYYLRLRGDPDPRAITGMPKCWHICTECATPEEKAFLEGKGKTSL